MIVFGPVPSRRLGRSLGINNIPPKICTYSCVYCQLGRTLKLQAHRQAFYDPEDVRIRERLKRKKNKILVMSGKRSAVDSVNVAADHSLPWPLRPRNR